MSNTKPLSQLARELELNNLFRRMTSDAIRKMMDETDNTCDKLTCWDYLQTL